MAVKLKEVLPGAGVMLGRGDDDGDELGELEDDGEGEADGDALGEVGGRGLADGEEGVEGAGEEERTAARLPLTKLSVSTLQPDIPIQTTANNPKPNRMFLF